MTPEHPPLRAKPGRQPVSDTGPMEYSELDDLIPELIAARETFDDQDIFQLWAGYVAVPAGSVVYAAKTVDALVEKLRRRNQEQSSDHYA